MLDDLLTVPEAAALLRVGDKWLYNAVAAKKVPHTKVGKHLRFSRAELEQYLERNHVKTA